MTPARRLTGLVAAAAAALALVACGGTDGSDDEARLHAGEALTLSSNSGRVNATIHADRGLSTGKNTFDVHFDPDATELLGARALMPVHGHGFHDPPIIQREDDGGYVMTDVVFYMSGLWKVMLDLQVEDSDDRVEFTVDVP